MRPDALIFDVDGTLAETEEAHREAFNAAFAAAGLPWHWDVPLYMRLLGTTGGKERIRRWCSDAGVAVDDETILALHADKNARYADAVSSGAVGLRPGIAALVDAARESGVRRAVATTTSRSNVDVLVAATFGESAAALFDVLVCGDEVPAKKPDPAVYLLALDRLGLPATSCVALEDSRNGVRAAVGAGLACLVTPGIYTADDDFTGAVVVATLEGLTPEDVLSLALAARQPA